MFKRYSCMVAFGKHNSEVCRIPFTISNSCELMKQLHFVQLFGTLLHIYFKCHGGHDTAWARNQQGLHRLNFSWILTVEFCWVTCWSWKIQKWSLINGLCKKIFSLCICKPYRKINTSLSIGLISLTCNITARIKTPVCLAIYNVLKCLLGSYHIHRFLFWKWQLHQKAGILLFLKSFCL